MAITVKSSGTQTATLTTEHTLLDTPDLGTYVLRVNLVNLAVGETVDLKAYTKILTGDGYDVAFDVTFQHAQGDKIVQSIPVVAPWGAKFTLTQNGGTGRSFKWDVVRLDV